MTKVERKIVLKLIDELDVGDVVVGRVLLEWDFLMTIPEWVAQYWFTQFFADTVMNERGMTPNQQPIKEWQEDFGVVVERAIAYPGSYRPICLHKGFKRYALYRSKEGFPEKNNF